MSAEPRINHGNCGEMLGIGEEFLFINKFSMHGAILKSTARLPTYYQPQAHFKNHAKVPASVLLEFASQSAAILLMQLTTEDSTPLIVDLKVRVIRSTDDLTKTTCEVKLEKQNKNFTEVKFQIYHTCSLRLLAKGNLFYGD